MESFDLIVIGGGSGGLAVAKKSAKLGARVALVEEAFVGGTCVNTGCVPKKITWFASEIQSQVEKYGPGYGVEVENLDINYDKFLQSRDRYIDDARERQTKSLENSGVELIEGKAKFLSNNEIVVEDQVYRSEKFVIATGARPVMPDIEGIELVDTSKDFFQWTGLPKSALIVGGGYIGVELAFVLRGFGVEIQLIHGSDLPIDNFDVMLSEAVMYHMEEAGINFIHNKEVDRFTQEDGLIAAWADEEEVCRGERAIFAVGRQPNSDMLNLEVTGVELEDSGHIKIDDFHKTTVNNIYALGDVVKRVPLTPAASRAGQVVAENLFGDGEPKQVDYDAIPTAVFAHPTIGSVGPTEAEAIEEYGEDNIQVYTKEVKAMKDVVAGIDMPHHYKFITRGEEEVLVAFHGIGSPIEETIQLFALLIQLGATRSQVQQAVGIHPTVTEDLLYF